jgi:hypothetical protein
VASAAALLRPEGSASAVHGGSRGCGCTAKLKQVRQWLRAGSRTKSTSTLVNPRRPTDRPGRLNYLPLLINASQSNAGLISICELDAGLL